MLELEGLNATLVVADFSVLDQKPPGELFITFVHCKNLIVQSALNLYVSRYEI